MLLLQSLFCWVGADNRYRFSFIIALSHLFFIIFSAIFHASFLMSFIGLLFSTIVITCTTKRRLTDGKLTKNWLYIPSLSFAVIGLIIISFNHQVLYWLTLLSASLSSILLTYPSSNNVRYIYGYYGPINLTTEKMTSSRNQRIEPTLSNHHSTNNNVNFNDLDNAEYVSSQKYNDRYCNEETTANNATQDIGELIRNKLLSNQNSKYVILGLLAIITIAMFTSLILSSSKTSESPINSPEKNAATDNTQHKITKRSNKITLPDDFSLMTTPYNGLIVHWQADENSEITLWDIRHADGEKSCQSVTFNNDESYRTTIVQVENMNEYVAEFSPLDTQSIVKNIAIRGSFTLCGYSFSLKGSQAALGKDDFYAEMLAL